MHTGIIIQRTGKMDVLHPAFKPGDGVTRDFANRASDAIRNDGVVISFSAQVSIMAIDVAMGTLMGVRDSQIKLNETYGYIEKEG